MESGVNDLIDLDNRVKSGVNDFISFKSKGENESLFTKEAKRGKVEENVTNMKLIMVCLPSSPTREKKKKPYLIL